MNTFTKHLTLLWLTALLTSCEYGKNYDHNILNEKNLSGTWSMVAVDSENGEISTITSNDTTSYTYATVGKDFDLQLNLNLDPKTYTSVGTYTTMVTTTHSEDPTKKEVTESKETFPSSGAWELRNEELILKTPNDEQLYEVYLFADHALGIKRIFNSQSQIESMHIISKGELNYTWVKEQDSLQ